MDQTASHPAPLPRVSPASAVSATLPEQAPGADLGPAPRPIVVDLDDTLLRTDTLLEVVLLMLRQRPWTLVLLPFWLLGGKAHLKRRIMEHVEADLSTLPVNEPLLRWLREQHAAGVPLHLFSAADERIVRPLARHFGIFGYARGSDGTVNLSGARKLEAIRALVGERFAYVGDHLKDVVIWQACGAAVPVGDVARLRRAMGPGVEVVAVFEAPSPGPRTWIKALRLHQWAKNALLFVAALLGGNVLGDLPLSALGFLSFGLLASATYLVNDMLDLAADRAHRSKRFRPLASGALPLRQGVVAVPVLLILAGLPMLWMPVAFAEVALLYVAVTLAYSFHVKRVLMLDVITLAGLFTVRILAGIAALHHPVTPWLLAFSMFFFLSLACVKRHSECLVMAAEGTTSAPGRAYRPGDAPWLMAMGAASGFSAMSTFFIFLVGFGSPILLYPHPRWMWLVCIILGYWICRTWALATRGEMNDDPVLFAVRDPLSLVLAGLIGVLMLLARY
ncbi:UbiA family prenyltransferase [Roseomonas elaeocarpi]|uniref:UbiA family prenyltransferase n=1 Tax=Roseomonas elaeocarpi TaxID=907779 RepID=A0ABV6JSF0_9PROT